MGFKHLNLSWTVVEFISASYKLVDLLLADKVLKQVQDDRIVGLFVCEN